MTLHKGYIRRAYLSPDCLLGEVTQLSESRLSETRHCQEVAHCAAVVRTISDDVIAVSAQQRGIRSRIGSVVDHFLSLSPRFSLCLLLTSLLLHRFTVVVVNGHGDIEMWTTSSTTRARLGWDLLQKAFFGMFHHQRREFDFLQVNEAADKWSACRFLPWLTRHLQLSVILTGKRFYPI